MLRYLTVLMMTVALGSFSFAQAQVELGKKAPDFTLKDSSGKEHSLAQHLGKIVVLEWINPECPFVQRHYKEKTMTETAAKYADKDVVWLAVNTTSHATPEEMSKWIAQYGLAYPILMDNSGEVGRKYGAKTTPHMFIIDRQGKVVYSGGIDNDPSGNKSDRANYVAKALNEVVDGASVSQPETKPYGCSIKFGK